MVTLGASWGSAIRNWKLLWGDTGEQDLWIKLWNQNSRQSRIPVYHYRQQFLFLHDPYVGVLEKK